MNATIPLRFAFAADGRAAVGIVRTCDGATIDDPARVECRTGQYKMPVPLGGN